MAYGEYLENVSSKFETLFSEISAEYNFDYGPEYEIALCKALRLILPTKFGISRGFVVTFDGVTAGDDIIIFDQERFPTLRLLADNDYAQKQKIPVEAVYAYIEAKHTLCLEGTGGQSLHKSCEQVAAVKNLPRQKVPLSQISPHIKVAGNPLRAEYWPAYFNPMFGAIVARHVRLKANGPIVTAAEASYAMGMYAQIISQPPQTAPDLIIAGSDMVCVPAVNTQIESPFFIEGVSRLSTCTTDKKGFGVGISILSWALDSIVLGNVYWPSVIASGLNVELANDERV